MRKTKTSFMGFSVFIDSDKEDIANMFDESVKKLKEGAYGQEASRLKAKGRVAEFMDRTKGQGCASQD